MSDMIAQAKKMGVNVEVFGEGNPFSDPAWYQAFNSPYYNDSHREWRAELRELIEENILPFAHEWDEAKEIPEEVYNQLGDLGFNFMAVGKPYPYKYGKCPKILEGTKIDTFHELIAIDEIARSGSGGVTWGLCGGLAIGLPPVMRFASEDMKQRVVPPVLAGKKKICLAITEPTAGSDVANIRCVARKDSDGNYIVNGEKKWITNGISADFFTTAVRTGDAGFKGVSFLLIERTMPGVKTRRMDCSGVWCSGTAYVTFEDVKVPKENLIGRENKGFKLMMKNFNHERFSICCQTNRFARVCLEESIKFANKRKTFGKKLIEHQVIRWKISEMSRQVEASHAWLEAVAYNIETMVEQEADIKLGGATALLKVQCTKVFEYCARESSQIFGGLSYSRGGVGEKIERLNREVRAMAIPGGSEEIMLDLGIRQMSKLAQMARDLLEGEQGQAKL